MIDLNHLDKILYHMHYHLLWLHQLINVYLLNVYIYNKHHHDHKIQLDLNFDHYYYYLMDDDEDDDDDDDDDSDDNNLVHISEHTVIIQSGVVLALYNLGIDNLHSVIHGN
ncbi:camp-dependent rap1 guanine-nucleotide exchange factor, putative [Schistosoma mansoni]|uniref:camp-dependent rap1 guanine-nucleotide exchange factor, putative n=1 Tax=Schistosoma mansoni TaxID=6183 RepID=UPI00022C828F|nr:camp-dependent rap1 guanine-nucleotide exchange factor, putative [Schistosoma mansoni]|eukprot:XP_018647193.1 camp-dependent rap1 guanine-nucleotide exchange factor, putative [Schistosoma mansoni]